MNAFMNIAYVGKSMKPFHVEMIKQYIKHTKEKWFACCMHMNNFIYMLI